MTFTDLGLSPGILQSIQAKGYETPTPIQTQAIPTVLKGVDVMAAAKTGTGKTASFTLPLLQRLSSTQKVRANQARSLILTPTRELATQVNQSIEQYSQHLPLRSTVVVGGVKINPQMMRLRRGVDILVATPGRLLDLYNNNAIRFNQLEVLILDEADRMLDMGFIHDIRKIFALLPKKRQTLMFSATFSAQIRTLAKTLLRDPVEISLNPTNTTAEEVKQTVYTVDKAKKTKLLAHLIKQNQWQQVLVFSRTKHGANRLARNLDAQGICALAIHGNKSQNARTKALTTFKNGDITALVATDIAARGIDIDLLPYVVNFDLPQVPEDYVHRIGRTGRAGALGAAFSLVCADEFKQLKSIERLIQKTIERKTLPGFEPTQTVPSSPTPPAENKRKKPKKKHKKKASADQQNTLTHAKQKRRSHRRHVKKTRETAS